MPDATVRFFGRLAGLLESEVLAAEEASLKDMLRIAQAIDWGGYSSRQLARMGHPYATRDPHPPLSPYVINRQSGLFSRSWQIEPPRRTAAGYASALINTAPYSGYLQTGTGKMIRRPFDRYLQRQMGISRRVERVAQAIRRAIATASSS